MDPCCLPLVTVVSPLTPGGGQHKSFVNLVSGGSDFSLPTGSVPFKRHGTWDRRSFFRGGAKSSPRLTPVRAAPVLGGRCLGKSLRGVCYHPRMLCNLKHYVLLTE